MAEATITIPSLEEIKKKFQKNKSFCIRLEMNLTKLLDYEPWQVIIRIEEDLLVLMKTDDFNQKKSGPVTKISYKDFKSNVKEIFRP